MKKIVHKKYLPFIEQWSEKDEYPRKAQECVHLGCDHIEENTEYVTLTNGKRKKMHKYRCKLRNLSIVKSELSCKRFKHHE